MELLACMVPIIIAINGVIMVYTGIKDYLREKSEEGQQEQKFKEEHKAIREEWQKTAK